MCFVACTLLILACGLHIFKQTQHRKTLKNQSFCSSHKPRLRLRPRDLPRKHCGRHMPPTFLQGVAMSPSNALAEVAEFCSRTGNSRQPQYTAFSLCQGPKPFLFIQSCLHWHAPPNTKLLCKFHVLGNPCLVLRGFLLRSFLSCFTVFLQGVRHNPAVLTAISKQAFRCTRS